MMKAFNMKVEAKIGNRKSGWHRTQEAKDNVINKTLASSGREEKLLQIHEIKTGCFLKSIT